MPLRGFNNPNDEYVIMGILQSLLPVDPNTLLPNTQIGLNQQSLNTSLIYIQQAAKMVEVGIFPAVLLLSGEQTYYLLGRVMRDGMMHIGVHYFDRWDQQPSTIDTINLNNSQDLKRMQSNLETNHSLGWKGQNYAMGIPVMRLSGYKGSIDNTTIPGFEFVRHDLDIVVNVLPYDCPN